MGFFSIFNLSKSKKSLKYIILNLGDLDFSFNSALHCVTLNTLFNLSVSVSKAVETGKVNSHIFIVNCDNTCEMFCTALIYIFDEYKFFFLSACL